MKDPQDLHKAGLELSGAVLRACGQMEPLLRVSGGGILGYRIKLFLCCIPNVSPWNSLDRFLPLLQEAEVEAFLFEGSK